MGSDQRHIYLMLDLLYLPLFGLMERDLGKKNFLWLFNVCLCQLFRSVSGVGRKMNIVLGEASAVSMIYDTQPYESFWNSHVIIILCFTDEDLVKKKPMQQNYGVLSGSN